MLKQTLNNYKLNTGSGFPKLIKAISTIGLSVAMMLSATFGISSCAPEVEAEHPPIVTPGDDENDKDNNDDKTHDNQDDPGKDDDQSKDDQGKDDDKDDGKDDQDKDDQQGGDDDQGKDDDGHQEEPPKFELNADTLNVIKGNLQSVAEVMCSKMLGYKEPNILKAYLCRENSTHLNTIGCVMITNQSIGFLHSKMTFNGVNEDLTWENIYKNTIEADINEKNYKVTNEFNASFGVSQLNNFDISYVSPTYTKAFNLEKFAPIWIGWNYKESILNARHDLIYIENNIIYKRSLTIQKNGQGIFEVLNSNYLNAKDDSTWSQSEIEKKTLVPEDYLEYLVDFTTQGHEEEIM